MSSDIDRIVHIVHSYQLQACVSGGELRCLPWHDRWYHSNGVVVSSSASGPSDIYGGSSFRILLTGYHDPTWSSWRILKFTLVMNMIDINSMLIYSPTEATLIMDMKVPLDPPHSTVTSFRSLTAITCSSEVMLFELLDTT